MQSSEVKTSDFRRSLFPTNTHWHSESSSMIYPFLRYTCHSIDHDKLYLPLTAVCSASRLPSGLRCGRWIPHSIEIDFICIGDEGSVLQPVTVSISYVGVRSISKRVIRKRLKHTCRDEGCRSQASTEARNGNDSSELHSNSHQVHHG